MPTPSVPQPAAADATSPVDHLDTAPTGVTVDAAEDAPVPLRCADSDEVKWLDADERAAWLGLNGILLKLPGLLDGQLQKCSGLSFFEYMVLAMLSEQPTPRLRMSRLSVLTNGSLSRLSHVAKRLEAQGYITRETDPVDRRSTNAILTAAGRAKVEEAAPGHVDAVRTMVIDVLTPEQIGQLTAIADAVLARIDPDRSARPRPGA